MADTCEHGYGSGSGSRPAHGGDNRKLDRHARRCRSARFMNHPAWHGLFRVICCLGCGHRVA